MTADKLQALARILANNTWCSYKETSEKTP